MEFVDVSESALKAAHKFASELEHLEKSTIAGCFYCEDTFAITDVDLTTNPILCPKCKIDSVIGDASGCPVYDAEWLGAMYDYWFAKSDGEVIPGMVKDRKKSESE